MKLLDQVREVMRGQHLSHRTKQTNIARPASHTRPARLPFRPPIPYAISITASGTGCLFMAEKSYAFVSLGCPKNLVDSERMLGKLSQAGYALTPHADGADVVVVNTCGFIDSARQESLGVSRPLAAQG